MNTEIFKAYDIRGVYPTDINEDVAYKIGRSYGSYLIEKLNKNKCVVGRDNRLSSPSLAKSLINGLLESGINVIDYGEITTPMHYYTRYIENTFGIMVTASHNPKDDNGFKFSFDELSNARGEMIEDFKNYTLEEKFLNGKGFLENKNIKEQYIKYMLDNINMGDKKVKVVFDPGNGVTSTIVKDIISKFSNIEAIYICDKSDGTFPNHHPDPAVEENMQMLKDKVKEVNADFGIGFDGDGDRIGIINEKDEFVMADEFMIIPLRDLINKVEKKEFLCDVKCSKSLTDEIEKLNGKVFMSRTGTSFTEANTKQNNLPLGVELSGHVFFNDRGPEICSCIYAALRFIEILSKTDKSFTELLEGITKYYSTPEIKIHAGNKEKFEIVNKVKEYVINNNYKYIDIDGVRITFNNSWALVRASNTGPNLTLRFEATTKEELNKIKNEFVSLVNKLNN
jgi:phosphomannomutase/phosphoglucomutase